MDGDQPNRKRKPLDREFPVAADWKSLRSCGLLAAFPLLMAAMKENKAQSKQAKDESVFFWFGDDLAVDPNLHRAVGVCRKPRPPTSTSP